MWKFFNSYEESLPLAVYKLAKYVRNCIVFWKKFTQLTKILHDRRSRRSRQIPSLVLLHDVANTWYVSTVGKYLTKVFWCWVLIMKWMILPRWPLQTSDHILLEEESDHLLLAMHWLHRLLLWHGRQPLLERQLIRRGLAQDVKYGLPEEAKVISPHPEYVPALKR